MSSLTDLLKKVPLTGGLQRWYGNWSTNRDTRRIVDAIAASPYPQGKEIAQAVSVLFQSVQGDERADIERIEKVRSKYLGLSAPLVDGTLGDGGLYDTGVSINQAFAVSKKPKPAIFLYMLVRALRPKTVLELGTNTGISSAFIAAALKRNGEGTILTLDASPYRQRLAQRVHAELGLTNVSYRLGLFTDTLAGALEAMPHVDLAFIDGHHQYQPTLDYYQLIRKHATDASTFMFDDIRWSDGMRQAWSELQADESTGLAVDLNTVGLTTLRRRDIPGTHVMDRLYCL